MRRRGQAWSMDVVLAVVIFGFIAIAFTSIGLLDRGGVQGLQQDAQHVAFTFEQSVPGCGSLLANNTLDNRSLDCLYGSNYDSFKSQQRISSDFCVYVEDEGGQLILINGVQSWGNTDLSVAGQPCGS